MLVSKERYLLTVSKDVAIHVYMVYNIYIKIKEPQNRDEL